MHNPMETVGLSGGGARVRLTRAAAHSMMLAAYLEATCLARPVVPKASTPDFVLSPEITPDVGKDSRSSLRRSVSLPPQEGPNGLQEGPAQAQVPGRGPGGEFREFKSGVDHLLDTLRGRPAKVPKLPKMVPKNMGRGPAPGETAEGGQHS